MPPETAVTLLLTAVAFKLVVSDALPKARLVLWPYSAALDDKS